MRTPRRLGGRSITRLLGRVLRRCLALGLRVLGRVLRIGSKKGFSR